MQFSCYLVLLLPTSAFAAVSTVVVTAAPSSPTNDPSYTSNSDFQNAILNSTNFYRDEHNASAVTWNDSLASFGASYANGCKFVHSVRISDTSNDRNTYVIQPRRVDQMAKI